MVEDIATGAVKTLVLPDPLSVVTHACKGAAAGCPCAASAPGGVSLGGNGGSDESGPHRERSDALLRRAVLL